jgi:nicotinate-nucleotide adenylyltransferase
VNLYFLGGSFDPPHLGHLKIAEHFINRSDLFLYIPAKRSPFKKKKPTVTAEHRFNMLKIMSVNFRNIKVDPFELYHEQESFTYITVDYLIQKYNPTTLNMIIGKDNLIGLKKWKNINSIREKCEIICIDREAVETDFTSTINVSFENFNKNVSSTKIKRLLKLKKIDTISNLVEPNVMKYILKHKLYR